ncbi:MAG: hypothetical protein AB1657_03735 [Candidatus Micrarchaeota archaeon]
MIRTTVALREDVYNMLISLFGKRNISEGLNKVLVEHLFEEKKKDMFGVDKWLQKTSMEDLREHRDRDI